MPECDNSVLYKFTDLHIRALDAEGKVQSADPWYKMGCPVDMGLDPKMEEGAEAILKCGGGIGNVIQEADKLTGMDLAITLGMANPEVEFVLAGSVGSITYDASSPPCAIGYTAPTTDEQDNAIPFELLLYEERREGSNIVGYYEYHLYMCMPSFPSLSGGQEDYSTPDWGIKCVENTQYDVDESPPGTGQPVYSWVIVPAIP